MILYSLADLLSILLLFADHNTQTYRLKHGIFTSNVASWDKSRPTNQTRAHIRDNVSVQVGHDHDIKLLGLRDQLHRRIVHDHVVKLDARASILLGDFAASVKEQSVGQFHDVGLVDASDLLAAVAEGKVKGKSGNPLRFGAGDHFERLDHTRVGLMLEARVLALSVLTDDGKIDALVTGGQSWDILAQDKRRVHVQVLADRDVEGSVACGGNRGVEDALESNLVAPQRLDGLLEGKIIGCGVARDVELLPVDGHSGGLEYGFDG